MRGIAWGEGGDTGAAGVRWDGGDILNSAGEWGGDRAAKSATRGWGVDTAGESATGGAGEDRDVESATGWGWGEGDRRGGEVGGWGVTLGIRIYVSKTRENLRLFLARCCGDPSVDSVSPAWFSTNWIPSAKLSWMPAQYGCSISTAVASNASKTLFYKNKYCIS